MFSRILAIGFGLLLLTVLEGAFRLLDLDKGETPADPFVGFSAIEPLFALNPRTNHYETAPEREHFFVKHSFHRAKPQNTYRIFAFGGSTVQGRPYSIETAFPKWLQLNLELAFPEKSFEVINCGGISYASYRLLPIMNECLSYDPDLFILCSGHNEFLESRTYRTIKPLAKPLGGLVKAIRQLATYRFLDEAYRKARGNSSDKPGKTILKKEVDALLDYRRGLEAYHRDRKWHWGVISHFQENIRRAQILSQKAGIPLVILSPPANLKGSPPFKSQYGELATEDQIEAIEEWLSQANHHFQTNLFKAAQYLEMARELDPQYALTHYQLGHAYWAQGRIRKAKASFLTALVEDVCALRILPTMRQFLNDFCEKNKIPHLDLHSLLLEHYEEPIMGSRILVDHIHPSIEGHQVIAEATAQLLFEHYLGYPLEDAWISKRKTRYKKHFATLDELYFTYGQNRLENLRIWTKVRTGHIEGEKVRSEGVKP